jgi:flagellar biosynthesis protein FlgN
MTRMTRDQALQRVQDGVGDDLDACHSLLGLLEQQFAAALHHRSARLTELAGEITPILESMEQRRVQRVALVRSLLGPGASMEQLIATLPAQAREALATGWRRLESLVVACKDKNSRNSALLADQFCIMQRVLHGEDQIYAPR